MRKIKFTNETFYHVYNRGVDKRKIFNNQQDVQRFLDCMDEFNTTSLAGSLYENSFISEEWKAKRKLKRLVNIVAFYFGTSCRKRNKSVYEKIERWICVVF